MWINSMWVFVGQQALVEQLEVAVLQALVRRQVEVGPLAFACSFPLPPLL